MSEPIRQDQTRNEQLGDALAEAWARYTEFFGEPPHGTAKQMRALCCLMGEGDPVAAALEAEQKRSARTINRQAERIAELETQRGALSDALTDRRERDAHDAEHIPLTADDQKRSTDWKRGFAQAALRAGAAVRGQA